MLNLCLQQENSIKASQDGSERAGFGGDGGVLRGDFGHGDLGVGALQEGGEQVLGGQHGDNAAGWTQDQPAGWDLHSDR